MSTTAPLAAHSLSSWGSEEAHQEYERLLARLRGGRPPVVVHPGNDHADMTIAEALISDTDHIEAYSRNLDGSPTGTTDDIKITLGYLTRLFASLLLREFDIRCFKVVRQALIDDNRVRKPSQPVRRPGSPNTREARPDLTNYLPIFLKLPN